MEVAILIKELKVEIAKSFGTSYQKVFFAFKKRKDTGNCYSSEKRGKNVPAGYCSNRKWTFWTLN